MPPRFRSTGGKGCGFAHPLPQIGRCLGSALLFGPSISLSNSFIGKGPRGEADPTTTHWMDWYILLWAGLLLSFLVLIGHWQIPHSHCLRVFVWIGVCYRIHDSVSYRLYFLFLKSKRSTWHTETARRSLSIAFANGVEVIIGFAILYLLSGQVCDGKAPLSGWVAALYYSVITITTLGYGDFVPHGPLSRFLVVAELIVGAMFLIVILPCLAALLTEPLPESNLQKQVRRRAHELYEQRGKMDGHSLDDWLQAEREITSSQEGEDPTCTASGPGEM